MKRIHLIIRGVVQGVFFRASAQRQAVSLKLAGFVRNMPDGSVEIIAEGKERKLIDFIDWCKIGPPSAKVDGMSTSWSEATGSYSDFRIR